MSEFWLSGIGSEERRPLAFLFAMWSLCSIVASTGAAAIARLNAVASELDDWV